MISFLIMIAGDLEPMDGGQIVLSSPLPFLGLIFELPVVVYFDPPRYHHTGVASEKRKYALLGIFVGCSCNPGGDPISQCLMGIPVTCCMK